MPTHLPLLLLSLTVPAVYLIAAGIVLALKPVKSGPPSAIAAMAAFIISLGLVVVTATAGPLTLHVTLTKGITPAVRLDAISMALLTLVTFVGLMVIRFSRNYLAGDPRQHVFFSRLMTTLAVTTVLVMAGDLAVFAFGWITLSLVLHGLLVFYSDRPLAVLAARKKFVSARLGDLCLIVAFVLLWAGSGTTDIEAIGIAAMANGLSGLGFPASLLIVLAALMKSAQWPFHGWITEVMETPTPVSALLHAGIVNAGGFAVLRFSNIIAESPSTLWVLAIVGGGTALFASVVMLTQSRIKTLLAWSTIAQMGFMLLQCGLGAFSSALLHILAHSLYKAHAFLWAGSAVDQVRVTTAASTKPQLGTALASLFIAVAIFTASGAAFAGALWEKPAFAVLGSVVVLGMGQAIAAGFAAGGGFKLMGRVCASMAAVSIAYFALQFAMSWLTANALHAAPPPSHMMIAIMGLTLASFSGLSIMQAIGLHHNPSRWMHSLHVHFSNGFYANAVFNRLAGALHINAAKSQGTRL